MGTEFLLGMMKSSGNRGDSYNIMNALNATESCTFKWFKWLKKSDDTVVMIDRSYCLQEKI